MLCLVQSNKHAQSVIVSLYPELSVESYSSRCTCAHHAVTSVMASHYMFLVNVVNLDSLST